MAGDERDEATGLKRIQTRLVFREKLQAENPGFISLKDSPGETTHNGGCGDGPDGQVKGL